MIRGAILLLSVLVGLLSSSWVSLEAQSAAGGGTLRVELGVEPRQVRVGEPFTALVSVSAPPGVAVDFLPFESDDLLQALEAPEIRSSASGAPVAVYRMVAWIAGAELIGIAPVRSLDAQGTERVHPIRMQLPEVVSVLPAGEEIVEPRPGRGVVVPSSPGGLPWWWWLALLLGSLLAALLAWRLLRRTAEEEVSIAPADPAEWALARLAELDARSWKGSHALLFLRVSWILRTFLWRIDRDLGPQLTTTEFRGRLGTKGIDARVQEEIGAILRDADRAKFARYEPTTEEAERLVHSARELVLGYVARTREAVPEPEERAA
jgi:hypothetical protein